MTEEQFNDFMDMFPNCPNPEYQPKQVEYLVKLYNYYTSEKALVASEAVEK